LLIANDEPEIGGA